MTSRSELDQLQREVLRLRAGYKQLFRALSHDLGAPLRRIEGFGSLLLAPSASELPSQTRRHLTHVLEGAANLGPMLDVFAEYLGIDCHGQPFESVSLQAVLEDVFTMLDDSRPGASQRIDSPRLLPAIVGDREQIKVAIFHLLDNATKFCVDAPQVTVGFSSEQDGWTLSVSDNGIGLRPKNRDVAFDLFRRFHTAEEYPGLGVGLALVQRIIERHSGRVWFGPGGSDGGATVYLSAPHAPVAPEEPSA